MGLATAQGGAYTHSGLEWARDAFSVSVAAARSRQPQAGLMEGKVINLTAVLVSAAFAAASPAEADFPPGYWDQEFASHGGRQMTAYMISVAVEDPAKARVAVEAALAAAGGKLTSFSDQSAAYAAYAGMEQSHAALRGRPQFTIGYQFSNGKAASVAKKLLGTGRLVSYSVQTPYQLPQRKEIEERIDWIEKEKARSESALKAMPVSRAMLDAKLKRLKSAIDAAKASDGLEAVTVSIAKEAPAGEAKPPSVQP